MSAITRTGPPVATSVTGGTFRFEAPLNEKPSLIWWQAFRNPGEWTSTCHPHAVSRVGERLIFESREDTVDRSLRLRRLRPLPSAVTDCGALWLSSNLPWH